MKYKFEGIGAATATLVMVKLATSPLAWLTVGIPGKFTFELLKRFNMWLASNGLVLMNVGIADVQTLLEQKGFDGTFDSALKELKKGKLSPEDKRRIDDKVIVAFRKFATFGSLRDGGNSGH